jgi:hypothetical protein
MVVGAAEFSSLAAKDLVSGMALAKAVGLKPNWNRQSGRVAHRPHGLLWSASAGNWRLRLVPAVVPTDETVATRSLPTLPRDLKN